MEENYLTINYSSDSEVEGGTAAVAVKKRKIDIAKEAQGAHKEMCEKAVSTMHRVSSLLSKIEKNLEKKSRIKYYLQEFIVFFLFSKKILPFVNKN